MCHEVTVNKNVAEEDESSEYTESNSEEEVQANASNAASTVEYHR